MIKHIILWRFTEEAKKGDTHAIVNEINTRFQKLIGNVEGLLSVEVIHTEKKHTENYHDIALLADFTDMEAVNGYMVHPMHADLREWDKQYVCERAGIDILG